MAFAVQARFVYPVDRPPIENGVVTIDSGRIVHVGTKCLVRDFTDLGDVALLPGLVNCHTHLEFSNLKKPLGQPGMALPDWIRLVIAERTQRDGRTSDPITAGLHEGVTSGTTTYGEIATRLDERHCDDAGLLVPYLEVIGFSRARAASAFAAISGPLDSITRRDVGISPHAPYTVSPELLRRLIHLACDQHRSVAMHLAESREELLLLQTGTGPFQELLEERSMWDASAIPRGARPLDYLQLLTNAPRSLVIHGNYLDDEEEDVLAKHVERMSLVYCPRTHAYFGHPSYPLPRLLQKGVRVVLGTDSRASNPDLNFFEELRQVYRSYPSLDPQAILRIATANGAEALGFDAEVGSISEGKYANLVAMPLTNSPRSADQAWASLLDGTAKATKVWFRGVEAW